MARQIAERADIIPALGELFRRHGFEGLSLSLITKQTGLGKGSLYNFFPGGKDEMAAAVLAHVQDWFETHIFKPLETLEPDDALATMFDGVEAYFRSGRRVCLIGAFALDETRHRFAAALEGYFSRWLAVLTGALCRAGFARSQAETLAMQVVAGIQGAIVLTRALDDEGAFLTSLSVLRRQCMR